MHEFNICNNIIDTVVAELGRMNPQARRLIKANVVIGRLRQIVPDYLKFAYETMTKGTPAEGSTLEVQSSPIVFACTKCAWSGPVEETRFCCPSCGSSRADIIGGKEMYLSSLEIEENSTESGGRL